MSTALSVLFAIVFLVVVATMLAMRRQDVVAKREQFIHSYEFPKGLLDRLGDKWPHLTEEQRLMVARGLRQFFLAHARSGKFVSMPSKAVDELWHQFILYTKAYADFCNKAFGRFMHHTPAAVLRKWPRSNAGLRRAWWQACRQEKIDPAKPTALPLLFALDGLLAIPDGFVYHPQCDKLKGIATGDPIYCGADLAPTSSSDGCGGGCGGGSGDSCGDGGGDGGSSCSSCGGGCGGGGD